MASPAGAASRAPLTARFGAFVLERYPFAAGAACAALERVPGGDLGSADAIEQARRQFPDALRAAIVAPPANLPETTPRVAADARWKGAQEDVLSACDGFLRRAAIAATITADERREILRGMTLTRATDNRLKAFFTSGDVRYGDVTFQGKGFRSLGQEAIYAAGIRLRRGAEYLDERGWRGDVIAPLIRDLGVVLAMNGGVETVRMVLAAQMAKAGPPMNGRDLHAGDFDRGILPAAAPLTIGTITIAGMAMGFAREGSGRVALSFVGDGDIASSRPRSRMSGAMTSPRQPSGDRCAVPRRNRIPAA